MRTRLDTAILTVGNGAFSFYFSQMVTYYNKKVLPREPKRHRDRGVSSTLSVVPNWGGGTPCQGGVPLLWGGVTLSGPGWGTPHPVIGVPPCPDLVEGGGT